MKQGWVSPVSGFLNALASLKPSQVLSGHVLVSVFKTCLLSPRLTTYKQLRFTQLVHPPAFEAGLNSASNWCVTGHYCQRIWTSSTTWWWRCLRRWAWGKRPTSAPTRSPPSPTLVCCLFDDRNWHHGYHCNDNQHECQDDLQDELWQTDLLYQARGQGRRLQRFPLSLWHSLSLFL